MLLMFLCSKASYRAIVIFTMLLLCLPIQLSAQESTPDIDEWDDYRTDLYMRGDQAFVISLGTTFPAVFFNNGTRIDMNFSPPVGGSGSLSYSYFLNSNIFLGIEGGIQFISSINGDSLFIIPLGIVRGGYQFLIWKLEIPVSAAMGISWQRFLGSGYFGFYMRGGLAAFYRATTNWSFGLTSNWYWFPQWTNDSSKNVDGNMIDLTLSARYHF